VPLSEAAAVISVVVMLLTTGAAFAARLFDIRLGIANNQKWARTMSARIGSGQSTPM
jgi:hypothetical protein